MTEPTADRSRRAARAGQRLRLHGLLAHWPEVMGQPEQRALGAQMLAWEDASAPAAAWSGACATPTSGRFKPLADFDWAWPKQMRPRAPSRS